MVVDVDFFSAMGRMDDVADISNCDVAWFAVEYTESHTKAALRRGFSRLTTLERAVEGLTGGHPVSLARFEESIGERLRRHYPEQAPNLGLAR